MKKPKQKLSLSTETVRSITARLTDDELAGIGGGVSTVATLCNCQIQTAKIGACP